ncbi:MAG: SAM-dependent DNA methyltransferase, partial [Bryobacteraceae bacterium]
IERWKKRDKEENIDKNKKNFFVTVQMIIDNNYDLSINSYKEINYEEEVYEKPSVILEKIEKIEEEIKMEIKKLKKSIK